MVTCTGIVTNTGAVTCSGKDVLGWLHVWGELHVVEHLQVMEQLHIQGIYWDNYSYTTQIIIIMYNYYICQTATERS